MLLVCIASLIRGQGKLHFLSEVGADVMVLCYSFIHVHACIGRTRVHDLFGYGIEERIFLNMLSHMVYLLNDILTPK